MHELWSDKSPALDCLVRGHLLVTQPEDLADTSSPIMSGPTAQWCLWCGGGWSSDHTEETED